MPRRRSVSAQQDLSELASVGMETSRRETRSSARTNAPSKKAPLATIEKRHARRKTKSRKIMPTSQASTQKSGSSQHIAFEPFTIPLNDKQISCERRGALGQVSLIFTHGAGGGLSNPATSLFADGFAEISPVVSFQGTMNLASRVKSFQAVLDHEYARGKVSLGGRSMGARAAVMVATHVPERVNALVLANYPLVGAQKGDVRDGILVNLPESVDVLFICGSQDGKCGLEMLKAVLERMRARCWLVRVDGADHGMGMRAKAKAGIGVMRRRVGSLAAEWLRSRDEKNRHLSLIWNTETHEAMSSAWQSGFVPSE